jgi:hypothetical protein
LVSAKKCLTPKEFDFLTEETSMLAFQSAPRRATLGAVVGACFVLVPGLAWAQSATTPAAPPSDAPAAPEPREHINLTGSSPTIDLSTPKPGPPVGRTYRQHEGFYVRVGGGLGSLLSASVDQGPVDSSSSGVTLELEALVGGSPASGLSIGGGLLASLQLSGDWDADGIVGSQSANLTTILVGPFADGYPHPRGGFHLGGLLGLASVAFDGPGGDGGSDALGVGGAGWVGYDAWVAPEWSIGGELRLDALRATNSDDDLTISKVGATLAVTVLYN